MQALYLEDSPVFSRIGRQELCMQESYHMILLSCTDGHCPRHEAMWPKAPPMLESAIRGFAARLAH